VELKPVSPPPADVQVEFRKTLGRFCTGVTVLTAHDGPEVHGMTANAFMSVSLDPPLVVVSIDRNAHMHSLMGKGTKYGVSVLSHEQQPLSDYFAKRWTGEPPGFEIEYVVGTPLIKGAVAHLAAEVIDDYWGGDHTLFLGIVGYTRWEDTRPLLFFGGKYLQLTPD